MIERILFYHIKIELNVFHIYTWMLYISEIIEYAAKLGIDVDREPHLLHLAQEGLARELPSSWKPW